MIDQTNRRQVLASSSGRPAPPGRRRTETGQAIASAGPDRIEVRVSPGLPGTASQGQDRISRDQVAGG